MSRVARRRVLHNALAMGLPLACPLWVKAAGEPAALRFDELYGGMSPQGLRFSSKVLGLRGQAVRLRGYAAPPLRADAKFLVLTRAPMAMCPFCASDADWPADILVVYCKEPSLIPGGQLLLATGTLEAGSAIDADTGFVSQLRLRQATLDKA
jgi:hypothetical protein